MGFTVIIPHNSSHSYFPDNSLSNFSVYLPHELYFETKYEVALTEILYTNNFYNIYDGAIQISYYMADNISFQKLAIPNGYYDLDSFITAFDYLKSICHDEIINKIELVNFEHSNKLKVRIKNNRNNINVTFSKKIAHKLGFICDTDELTITKTTVSDYPVNFFKGMSLMKIYTNIIEPQIVGNNFEKLLRNVTIDSQKLDDHIFTEFENLHYIPVSLNNIRRIEIDIRNEYNDPIPFRSGEVMVTLHFRKCLL